MSSERNVEAVLRALRSATTYGAVFGPLPAGDVAKRRNALRQQFAYLALTVHPDHVPGDEKLAGEAFELLNTMRKAAEGAITNGSYDAPFVRGKAAPMPPPPRDSGQVLKSAMATYRLSPDAYRPGDFSILYRAWTLDTPGREVLVKIAAEPSCNALLEKEARLLKRFRASGAGNPLSGIGAFLPELLDTFIVPSAGGRRFRANVMPYAADQLSLTDIATAFPSGLDPRDAAWIIRRVIAQTLAASMAGVVHGALVPDHVLVDPIKHEPLHIGWLHAVDSTGSGAGRVEYLIDRWRDWYPPEVLAKETPDHRTDLYMAGKTMIWLLSGNTEHNTLPAAVPERIQRFVLRLVEPSRSRRPSDGLQLLDEFTRIVRELWGRTYRPLMVPVR